MNVAEKRESVPPSIRMHDLTTASHSEFSTVYLCDYVVFGLLKDPVSFAFRLAHKIVSRAAINARIGLGPVLRSLEC